MLKSIKMRRMKGKKQLDIKSLGELDNDTLDEYSYLINDETELKRARHAVSENQRFGIVCF